MVAITDHPFLINERDNRSQLPTPPNVPQVPNLKRIYKIDLTGATDVSNVAHLPAAGGAALTGLGITPVTKSLFIDLLDPAYKVDLTHTIKDVIAEKIEGLAWGPDLADGRHVLYVTSDNDLYTPRPTQIYAFAVNGAAAGIQLVNQRVSGPPYPPGRSEGVK